MYVYWFSYIFDTVLYQFLETGTSDKTFMGRDQELKWLAFSLYPLSFFLYSPFKRTNLPIKGRVTEKMPFLAKIAIEIFFSYFMKKSAIECVTNNDLAHKICHTCKRKSENLPQTWHKCIKSATQIMNELKICHKIMLYHIKFHNKCHKLYSDKQHLPQMQMKRRESATNII